MSAVEDGGSDLAFSFSTRRTLRSKPVVPIVPPTIVEPVEPAMPIMKRATSIVSRLRASAQGMMKTGRAKEPSAKMRSLGRGPKGGLTSKDGRRSEVHDVPAELLGDRR